MTNYLLYHDCCIEIMDGKIGKTIGKIATSLYNGCRGIIQQWDNGLSTYLSY